MLLTLSLVTYPKLSWKQDVATVSFLTLGAAAQGAQRNTAIECRQLLFTRCQLFNPTCHVCRDGGMSSVINAECRNVSTRALLRLCGFCKLYFFDLGTHAYVQGLCEASRICSLCLEDRADQENLWRRIGKAS